MTCHHIEADLVDLARGADLGTETAARVGEHVERCSACAARFERERRLTAGLKTLAGPGPRPDQSAALEARLLDAFAAAQADVTSPLADRNVFAMTAPRRWIAAAAVLVVAVAGWLGYTRWPSPGGNAPVTTQADARRGAPDVAAEPGGEGVAVPVEVPAGAVPLSPRPVSRDRQPSVQRAAADAQAVGGERLEFLALPTAAGLPTLESGQIIRVDVPLAVMPAYGFDIAPEDMGRVVEADVLVGQDGQPRAIRFVSPASDSDSRR